MTKKHDKKEEQKKAFDQEEENLEQNQEEKEPKTIDTEDNSDEEGSKLEELKNNLHTLSDKHLRLQAEFDNFRKRTIKEKADLIKSGGATIITGLLPVIDDFERAINTMKEVSDDDSNKSGIILIYNKFRDFLKKNNVAEIEAMGEEFDVNLHDAITKIPAPDKTLKGKIVDVVEKGYLLNDKVIRYAKVVIGE